jgi:signal transduction histidine kinase/CheY-like chemotaxis protein
MVETLNKGYKNGDFIGVQLSTNNFSYKIGTIDSNMITIDKSFAFSSGDSLKILTYHKRPEKMIAKVRKNVILGIGLLILVLGGLIGFVINQFIHLPIQKIINITKQVKDGHFEARIENQNKDEIGQLSQFFDEMLQQISEHNDSLLEINQDLVEARDEAIHSNRARGAFLANMSHEIRTPLTSIIGYAEATLRKKGDQEARIHFVKTIIRSGKHLMKIISDILDLSKIESQKYEVEIMKTDFSSLLEEVKENVKYGAELKGLTFKTNYNFPLPRYVKTDPTRLKQILLNLGNNAVKFTKEGSVTFSVFAYPDKDELYFKMTDTGIGMTPQQQSKVFSAFTQADNSTSRKFGGTGLGLYISKELSSMLGGGLEVSGEKGKGSCFCLTVNSKNLEEERLFDSFEQFEKEEVEVPQLENLSGKILLVEDLEDLQELALMFLEDMGLEVDCASNGLEAVQKMLENGEAYDLILLDIQMPLISGIETIKVLKRLAIDIPVIALSGNVMTEDVQYYHQIGFDACLAKPINWEQVIPSLPLEP